MNRKKSSNIGLVVGQSTMYTPKPQNRCTDVDKLAVCMCVYLVVAVVHTVFSVL